MNTPKSKFFLHLISHLDFFETLKSALHPLYLRAFQNDFQAPKKVKSGYAFFLYHSDYQNGRIGQIAGYLETTFSL